MGLATVDVTPLGIVMTSDSQPVELLPPDRFAMPEDRSVLENHILSVDLDGFRGFASYVGTITVGGLSTRNWLARALGKHCAHGLGATCAELAGDLTSIWTTHNLVTHLSIFVAGYQDGEPHFWYVANGGFPSGEPRFPRTFDAVDDLNDSWFPRNARKGESKAELLSRLHVSFRRGVMPVATIFDRFTKVVEETFDDGQTHFARLDTLDRYAAYARFRFEFTKRMYEPKKGIAVDPYPPVRGTIHVVSIDPESVRREHGKDVTDVKTLS